MAQATGIVRGGLVISKIFVNCSESVKNVELDTKYTNLFTEKYVK